MGHSKSQTYSSQLSSVVTPVRDTHFPITRLNLVQSVYETGRDTVVFSQISGVCPAHVLPQPGHLEPAQLAQVRNLVGQAIAVHLVRSLAALHHSPVHVQVSGRRHGRAVEVHPLRQSDQELPPLEGVQGKVPHVVENLGNGVAGPVALTSADVDVAVHLHQAESVARFGGAVRRVRSQAVLGPGVTGKGVRVEDVYGLSGVQSATANNVETERKNLYQISLSIYSNIK